MKKLERGIDREVAWIMLRLGGTDTTLGTALVIVRMKEVLTDEGSWSDTVRDIV
jgi:hypothetical protein